MYVTRHWCKKCKEDTTHQILSGEACHAYICLRCKERNNEEIVAKKEETPYKIEEWMLGLPGG